MAARRPYDGPSVVPGDGRLDLDSLDLTTDLENLDVIGEERPTLAREARRLARAHRPAPLPRPPPRRRDEHRRGRRPRPRGRRRSGGCAVPPRCPRSRTSSRAPPAPTPPRRWSSTPARACIGGRAADVVVTSAEARGVALRLLGVSGPGLATDRAPGGRHRPAQAPTAPVVGSDARLHRRRRPRRRRCVDGRATTRWISSAPPRGRRPVDERADRRLRHARRPTCTAPACRSPPTATCACTGRSPRPVPGMVAVDLDVTRRQLLAARRGPGCTSRPSRNRSWRTTAGEVELEPGTTGHLEARFWPRGLRRPGGPLRDGISVDADLGPDRPPPSEAHVVDRATARAGPIVDQVARVAVRHLRHRAAARRVSWARLREGGGQGSAGIVDFGLTVTAPGVGIVEIDHLGDVAAYGEVFAFQSPAHVIDGTAAVTMQWRTPAARPSSTTGSPSCTSCSPATSAAPTSSRCRRGAAAGARPPLRRRGRRPLG